MAAGNRVHGAATHLHHKREVSFDPVLNRVVPSVKNGEKRKMFHCIARFRRDWQRACPLAVAGGATWGQRCGPCARAVQHVVRGMSTPTGLCMTVHRLVQLLRLLRNVTVAKWDRQKLERALAMSCSGSVMHKRLASFRDRTARTASRERCDAACFVACRVVSVAMQSPYSVSMAALRKNVRCLTKLASARRPSSHMA